MGRVLFSISEELLVDAMSMPKDTKIDMIGLVQKYGYTTVDILAAHEDIPGKKPHDVVPIVTVDGYCERCQKPLELKWDWNVPETDAA